MCLRKQAKMTDIVYEYSTNNESALKRKLENNYTCIEKMIGNLSNCLDHNIYKKNLEIQISKSVSKSLPLNKANFSDTIILSFSIQFT